MPRPLEGVKVVEVAMWAFVPAAGGILSDLGADVTKVEPVSGDPLRGLQIGLGSGDPSVDLSWESYNRGKRSITLDLKKPAGREVLMALLADADVFTTNLLPKARRSMEIDADTLRTRFPGLIYASGSAVGPNGPEAEKGGFDSITFWSRGGIASAMEEPGSDFPPGPPGPAFGDTLAGSILAGAICAGLVGRARTGLGCEVDVSLFGAAMWTMQRLTAQSAMEGVDRYPRNDRERPNNVLVNTYRTADDRFVSLCMLQADRYWPGFCEAAGRPDLAADPRYSSVKARREHLADCLAELKSLFRSKPLERWREILASQEGQWDVVQHVGELHADAQVKANGYIQSVRCTAGIDIPLVSVPMQFDRTPLPIGAAPELGADSDAVLAKLGYDEDAIIGLKVDGVVF